MKYILTITAGAALLAACEPQGPDMAAICRGLTETEPQMQSLLTYSKTEAGPACDCYAKMVTALPEPRRTAISQGLSDMIAERDARGLDMEGVFSLYRSGEIPLEEKPYTLDDLGEAPEMLEEAAEAAGKGACSA